MDSLAHYGISEYKNKWCMKGVYCYGLRKWTKFSNDTSLVAADTHFHEHFFHPLPNCTHSVTYGNTTVKKKKQKGLVPHLPSPFPTADQHGYHFRCLLVFIVLYSSSWLKNLKLKGVRIHRPQTLHPLTQSQSASLEVFLMEESGAALPVSNQAGPLSRPQPHHQTNLDS